MKKTLTIIVIIFILPIIALLIMGIASGDDIRIPEHYRGHYVSIAGEKIRCYQTGNGPDILLIHGLPGSIEDWDPIIRAAAAQYRVTAYDRPGHGFSSAVDLEYNLKQNADIALLLIDHLKLKDVIVVGHSYGGSISYAMAVRNPKQVKCFVSIAGGSKPGEGPLPIYRINTLPGIGRGFAVVGSRLLGSGMIEEGLSRAFDPNSSFLSKELIETRSPIWLQTKVIMTIAHEEVYYNKSIGEIMPMCQGILKPVYLIHGDSDKLVPVEHSIDIRKKIRNARLNVLKNTGHMVQFVHPEAVMEAIDSLR
ncbi:MAG: alpha/beta hydrolase [Spirochaetes bacterium]|nr:alpha/beta hydrolase [Spirochaetota bacterium]